MSTVTETNPTDEITTTSTPVPGAPAPLPQTEPGLELGDSVLGSDPLSAAAAAALIRRMTPPAAGLNAIVAELRGGPSRDRDQQLEALLFSTQFPLTVTEIAQATGSTEQVVVGCLARLERALADRPTAMGLFVREKAGQRAFILDLKTAFRHDVAAVAPPLLKPAVTETLALIAINQPLPQARLVRERGSTVYEHVKELLDRGLIARSRKGRNFHLRTTDAFAAEFGLDNDPELIRRALARAAGIQGTPEVVGSARLHWDGVGTPEGAEPRDVNALAAGLVAEAREFVPPPAPPAPPKQVESVADIIAAEAARIAAESSPARAPAPVAVIAPVAAPAPVVDEIEEDPPAKDVVEDCVVNGGTPATTIEEEPVSQQTVARTSARTSAEPTTRSDESMKVRRQKAEAAEAEARAKVTDLMNLLEDKSTTDDW